MSAAGTRTIVFEPVKMQDLDALAGFIESACAEAAAGEDAAFALRLAAEEVFTNIIQHGYRGGPGPLRVTFEAAEGHIALTLTDEAPHFDPKSVTRPSLDAPLEEREPGGLGWHLVEQVMDEVRWTPVGDRGNEFELIKAVNAVHS